MDKLTITIRQALLEDSQRLSEFRIAQFKTAKEFQIIDTKSLSEFKGQVMIAEVNNEIISTMQFQKLSNLNELILNQPFHVPKEFNEFETLYLSKAATLKEYRNSGINSYLRWLILKIAITDNSVQSLSGSAYGSAPRMNVLKRIGYNIVDTHVVDDYLLSQDNPVFIWMRRIQFESAINQLNNDLVELRNNYKLINKI